MPKLIRISGKLLMKILQKEGFVVLRQKGSHVRLVKRLTDSVCYITIPLHPSIDRGTLKSILRSLQRCIDEKKLTSLFYA